MTASIAPNPLPAGYGPEGLETVIRTTLGCEARWVVDYDVTDTRGTFFVHEFDLIGHSDAKKCFVVRHGGPGRPTTVYTYVQDDDIRSPEDAVDRMLAERAQVETGS